MANPQKENGYTAIANEIMDALIKYRIPGEQRQCLDYIIRKTYGFNKKEDMISNSQFAKATGLKKPSICRALNGLIDKNIVSKKDNKRIPTYQFNKNYKNWKVLAKKITVSKKVNSLLAKKLPTKDIYTKDNIYPDFKFKKKVKIPSNIFLTDKMQNYALKQGATLDYIPDLFEGFVNYYNRNGTKWQDWTRTFYDWVRNDKKKYNPDKYKKAIYGKAALYCEAPP